MEASDKTKKSPTTVSVFSALREAAESSLVEVEAGFMRGFSGLQLIGNASEVCRSGLERSRSALETVGIKIPARKIIMSLLPADMKKDGNQFDLAFAVALALLITKKNSLFLIILAFRSRARFSWTA